MLASSIIIRESQEYDQSFQCSFLTRTTSKLSEMDVLLLYLYSSSWIYAVLFSPKQFQWSAHWQFGPFHYFHTCSIILLFKWFYLSVPLSIWSLVRFSKLKSVISLCQIQTYIWECKYDVEPTVGAHALVPSLNIAYIIKPSSLKRTKFTSNHLCVVSHIMNRYWDT